MEDYIKVQQTMEESQGGECTGCVLILSDCFISGRTCGGSSHILKHKDPKPEPDNPQAKAVDEFYAWYKNNAAEMLEKGHDVIGCVREWEDTLSDTLSAIKTTNNQ